MKTIDKELASLALATVEQAVKDWRYLCKGGVETKHCNFKELEHFFERDCDTYLTGTSLDANRIYEKLRSERCKCRKSLA